MKPVVDVHAHAVMDDFFEGLQSLAPEVAPQTEAEDGQRFVTTRTGRRLGPLPLGMFQREPRLRDMDAMGITHQAVSAPPWMFNYDLDGEIASLVVAAFNDSLLAFAHDAPDRISVLASLPMQSPGAAIRELERITSDPAVRGVAIGSSVEGVDLDDASFDPVWAAIQANDLGILVHPGEAAGKERMRRYYMLNLVGNPLETTLAIASLIFGGVIMRYPGLRFCFVHGGGFAPYQLGRWVHGWEVRPESKVVIPEPPDTYFSRVFFDSLTHDWRSLEFLIDRVGVEQIMLGSDYMFPMGDNTPVSSVEALNLPAEAHAKVMHENSERFLRPSAKLSDVSR